MGRKYRVEFRPDEDGFWAITVRGHGLKGCFTQARSVEQGLKRAREALEVSVEEAESKDAEFVVVFAIPAEQRRRIAKAKRLTRQAEVAQMVAASLMRDVARELTSAMSVRAAGELLGISGQRVHQLVSDKAGGGR